MKQSPKRVTALMSTSFFLVFFTTFTIQYLNTTIFQQEGLYILGFISLAFGFFAYALGSWTSKYWIKKIGIQRSLITGILWICTFNFWIIIIWFVQLIPVLWIVIMFTSMLSGYGYGIFWVAQGVYMTITIPKETRTYYMGIFYGSLMVSGVAGGLVTAFLLQFLIPWVVILILAFVCSAGIIPLLWLDKIDYVDPDEALAEKLAPEEEPEYRPPIGKLLLLFSYTGVFVAFSEGIFPLYVAYSTDSDVLVRVILTTTFMSLGQSTGGFLWGRVSKIWSEHLILGIGALFMIFGGIITCVLATMPYNYTWFLAAFFLGQSDGALMTWVLKLASVHDVTPVKAFTKLRISHAFSSWIVLLIAPFVIPYVPVYVIVLIVVIMNITSVIFAIISHFQYRNQFDAFKGTSLVENNV